MRVAKRFRWEAAHRLPWHTGGCQNLHGHSYGMTVSLDGAPGAHGMVMDFKHLKRVLKPLVDAWDHATLVAEDDADLLDAVRRLGTKHVVLPFDTTSENLCLYVADYLKTEGRATLQEHGIVSLSVRIHETETSYAEYACPVDAEDAMQDVASHASFAAEAYRSGA